MKKILCFFVTVFIFNTFSPLAYGVTDSLKSNNSWIISGGYGYPSLLPFILINSAQKKIEILTATNPLMLKVEKKHRRHGLGITFTTNYQHYKIPYVSVAYYHDVTWVTYNIGARYNFYLLDKQFNHKYKTKAWQSNWQTYIGGGVGYIKAIQTTNTKNTALPVQEEVTETYGAFPMSFEATIGTRYLFNQHLGLFFEAGLGNSPIQIIDQGLSDSYLQSGISFRF
jgi:hypothetical protein